MTVGGDPLGLPGRGTAGRRACRCPAVGSGRRTALCCSVLTAAAPAGAFASGAPARPGNVEEAAGSRLLQDRWYGANCTPTGRPRINAAAAAVITCPDRPSAKGGHSAWAGGRAPLAAGDAPGRLRTRAPRPGNRRWRAERAAARLTGIAQAGHELRPAEWCTDRPADGRSASLVLPGPPVRWIRPWATVTFSSLPPRSGEPTSSATWPRKACTRCRRSMPDFPVSEGRDLLLVIGRSPHASSLWFSGERMQT